MFVKHERNLANDDVVVFIILYSLKYQDTRGFPLSELLAYS